MRKGNFRILNLVLGLGLVMATSCSVPKNVSYFQDADSATIIQATQLAPMKIKPGEKLSIVVKAQDPEISALLNLPVYTTRIGQGGSLNGSGASLRSYAGQSESVASYTVSPEGNIDFPVLGNLHVAGMSRAELSGYIKGELMGRGIVKDPTIIVEFLSAGVNIIGEVMNPGRYDMNKDNLTIIDALALAGDLTINGQRTNVKVLRNENGEIRTYILDLTNIASMVNSPGYLLEQNDVVYVEPDNIKKRSTTVNANNALSVGFWMSVASVLTSVVTTIAVFVS